MFTTNADAAPSKPGKPPRLIQLDRLKKEPAMRLRKLRALIKRLKELQSFKKELTRDELLMAVGQAKAQAGRAFKLLDISWPEAGQAINAQTFTFRMALSRYRKWYRREGRYLLRTNLTEMNPKLLWEYYLQLVAIEAAFKNLKDDLQIRPIFHQKEQRIEAHIFVAYLAYCLQVTLQAKLRRVAGGLTPRAVLEKFATMQMMDVFFPTEQPGKELLFRRHTQPRRTIRCFCPNWAGNYPSSHHLGSAASPSCSIEEVPGPEQFVVKTFGGYSRKIRGFRGNYGRVAKVRLVMALPKRSI